MKIDTMDAPTDLETIERAAQGYADARAVLGAAVTALQDAVEKVRRAHLPAIREALVTAQSKRYQLSVLIADARPLFEKRRTRTIAGIKLGFQKQRGKVEIADEAKTIERIRALLPADQAELLIRVRENVHKPAVYDLMASDLKRLGIAIGDDTDVIVLKPADDALDRLLAELLPDTEAMGDAE